MSTPDIIKESIAPLVQRILSDPLHFKSAKHPDLIAHRPSSYVKIGQTTSIPENSQSSSDKSQSASISNPQENESSSSEMAKTRPTSLAQAIAGYTGKRLSEDATTLNKKGKKIRKLNKQQEISGSVLDEDLGEDLESVTPEPQVNQESNDSDSADGEDQDISSTPDSTEDNKTPESTQDSTYQQESSSSDDDTNYTDAEGSDFVSETPRNIISAKVYKKYQTKSTSPSDESSVTSQNESESETIPKEDESTIGAADDDEEDEDDDDDYVDASALSEDSASEEESEGSDNADEDEATESAQEDEVALMKKDLLAEKAEAEAATTGTNTPPTSPESDEESDDAKTKNLSELNITDFYGIEESPGDRGSNHSKRIVKNWGPQFSTRKPLGLLNHGVTCYTNAAVQAMIHIPAVQHYLSDVLLNKYKDTINSRSVTQVLAETSARMWGLEKTLNKKGSAKFINPKKLIGRLDDINCMMSEWQQEDSHEYFMSLLSRLQEDSTPKGHKLNESILYDIFGGLLDQMVTCKNCGHVSKTQQEFYDLSLHLGNARKNSVTDSGDQQQQLQSSQQLSQDNTESKHRYSINKSIRDFFSPELIKTDRSDKSGYVCEKCKKRTNAIKISTIDRAPETLAVHLKRFRFNGNSSSKVKQGVSYPLILDLSEYTTRSEPVLYQLISVIVHEGRSVSSGHYIAHCRQPDGVWATYDDEYINTIPEKQALRDPSAYYLIYTRLTHKDVAQNKISSNMNPETIKSSPLIHNSQRSASSPSTSSASTKAKMKSIRAGIITPNLPSASSLSLSPISKKQKFKGIKPTNNLGNISGNKQKRYSKDQGHNKNSKRFRKY